MPRILPVDPRVPILEGVLLPAQAVRESVRIYTTVQQARAHARRLIRDATLRAEAIERQAMIEGFQAGWVDSLNAIWNALADSNALYLRIEQSLKQAVHTALETALQRPELELQLLESWLAAHVEPLQELHIIVPQHAKAQIDMLKRRVDQLVDVKVSISAGEGNGLTIESGEQVFEFSPDRTLIEFDALAHRCFQRLQVHEQCVQWSQEIVQRWLADVRRRYERSAEEAIGEIDLDELEFDPESVLNYFRN